MKCLFAHDHMFVFDGRYFYSRSGLPQSVLARYANAFGEVHVTGRVRRIEVSNLEPITDPRIYFHPQDNLRTISGIINLPKVQKAIAELVDNMDVVVARLPSLIGWVAARQARLNRKPYIIEVVGNALEASFLHGSSLGYISGPIEHMLTLHEIKKANYCVYITESYLQGIYPTKGRAFVCPNVKVTPISRASLEDRLCRPHTGLPLKIGLVGSLDVNYKGHESALRVLQYLKREYADVKIQIEFVGSGNKKRWRELSEELGVSDSVKFLGSLPPGEPIMHWLDSIDLCLQPSKTEGQGRSIIEGMSRGCPVVASNVGGIPELLDPEFVVEPGDIQGLAKACANLLFDESTRKRESIRNWSESHRFNETDIEDARRKIFEGIKSYIH